jgi:glutamate 5-kinase
MPAKQMLAAVGQPRLMNLYSDLFGLFDIKVAQILLTRGDLSNRSRYLNARDTLKVLLDHRVVPIINENDTVATEEIRLGDNDNLSALVANVVDADLLVLLTDQPGFFTTDPRRDSDARLIPLVEQIDDELFSLAGGSGTNIGTGGMTTKLQAARLATRSGTTVVIAQGSRPQVLPDLIGEQGRDIGTWFEPTVSHLESFKRWLLSEKPQGTIWIDEGAISSLKKRKSSLLPVGMTRVEGEFERGMAVRIMGPDDDEIARGLSNYAANALSRLCRLQSDQIEKTLGYSYGDEVIPRDNLIIVSQEKK